MKSSDVFYDPFEETPSDNNIEKLGGYSGGEVLDPVVEEVVPPTQEATPTSGTVKQVPFEDPFGILGQEDVMTDVGSTEQVPFVDPFGILDQEETVSIPQAGFSESFTGELKKIVKSYDNLIDHPDDAWEGIKQAADAWMSGDTDISEQLGLMWEDVKGNPSAAAGVFLAQILNPINYIPMGVGVVAGRAASVAGKLAGTAAGTAAGAATGGVLGVVDESLVATSEGKELTPEQANNAGGLGFALGGVLSTIPAHLSSARSVSNIINEKTAHHRQAVKELKAEQDLHREALNGLEHGFGKGINFGVIPEQTFGMTRQRADGSSSIDLDYDLTFDAGIDGGFNDSFRTTEKNGAGEVIPSLSDLGTDFTTPDELVNHVVTHEGVHSILPQLEGETRAQNEANTDKIAKELATEFNFTPENLNKKHQVLRELEQGHKFENMMRLLENTGVDAHVANFKSNLEKDLGYFPSVVRRTLNKSFELITREANRIVDETPTKEYIQAKGAFAEKVSKRKTESSAFDKSSEYYMNEEDVKAAASQYRSAAKDKRRVNKLGHRVKKMSDDEYYAQHYEELDNYGDAPFDAVRASELSWLDKAQAKIAKKIPENVKKSKTFEKVKSGYGTLDAVVRSLVGQSVERIHDIGNRGSSSITEIATRVGGSKNGDGLINSYQHDVDRIAGNLKGAIHKNIGVARMTTPDEVSLDRQLRGIEKSSPAALKIRKALDDMADKAIAMGVDMHKVKDYLRRRYDTSLLKTPEASEAFIGMLVRKYKFSQSGARRVHQNIISSNVDEFSSNTENFSRLAKDDVGGLIDSGNHKEKQLGQTKGRSLYMVKDADLEPFLRRGDVVEDLYIYADQMARQMVYVKNFGAKNEYVNDLLKQGAAELKKNGSELKESDLSKIYDTLDALRFNNRPLDLEGDSVQSKLDIAIDKANAFFIPAMHLITLPLATIGSLAELGIILSRSGNGSAAYRAGLRAGVAHIRGTLRTVFKKTPPEEVTQAVADLNIGMNAGFKRITESLMNHESKLGARVSGAFFKFILLDDWTRTMMVIANETGKASVIHQLKSLSNGTAKDVIAVQKELVSLKVDINKGIEWARRGAKESDQFFEETIKSAGLNFVYQTVMMPNPANLPNFHSNPRYRLIVQLKSFPTMFGNTVLPAWGNTLLRGSGSERTAVAAGLVSATMIGMISNEISDYIRYGSKGNPRRANYSPFQYVMAGLDRAGIPAMGSSLADIIHSPQYGRSWVTTPLGPTASYVEGGLKALLRDDWAKSLPTYMTSVTPFLNIHKPLRKGVADTITDTLKGE